MDDKRNLGHAKFKELSPTGEESIRTLLGDTAPGTYRQILEVAFGDLYQRQNLDPKIRQTVALVAVAAGGHERELRIHIISRAPLASRKASFQRCSSRWRRSQAFLGRSWAYASSERNSKANFPSTVFLSGGDTPLR
jgi:Carboxymuconolactone decarboxylase family